ncbi:Hypothetical_protein [Hexamita inflata]|uniref:Hypothetical_protein n=1 Tax=Hexamita inflata TaxID=28002 RepID=A0ABP1GS44_9EUKA
MNVQFTTLQVGNLSCPVAYLIKTYQFTVIQLNLSGSVRLLDAGSLQFQFGSVNGWCQSVTVTLRKIQSHLTYQIDTQLVTAGLVTNSTDLNTLVVSDFTIYDTFTVQDDSSAQLCCLCNISGTISMTAVTYRQTYSGAYSMSYSGLVGTTLSTCGTLLILNSIISINMSSTAQTSLDQSYIGACVGLGLGGLHTYESVIVEYFKLTGFSNIGALSGQCSAQVLTKVNVTNGTVTVNNQQGGVIGGQTGANTSFSVVFITNLTCSGSSSVGIVGVCQSANITFVQVNASNITFSGGSYGGGFVGYSLVSNITVTNCLLSNFTLQFSNYGANFVAFTTGSSGLMLNIQNSIVKNSSIASGSNMKAVWSNDDGLMARVTSGSSIVDGTVNGANVDGAIVL